MQKIEYIRKGYHAITPAIAVRNAARAISWYKKVFGAQELMCMKDADGTVVHAEIKIGDSVLMLAEENPAYNRSPESLQASTVVLNLYVPDADIVFSQATNEGAAIVFALQDQFYGDRSGRIKDPFGHLWIIASVREYPTAEEVSRRYDELSR
jgi:PhnB protein